MKAQSLSINTQSPCDGDCPCCISKLTWKTNTMGNDLIERSLAKAMRFAVFHNVDTVLITGSGEPTLDEAIIFKVIETASDAGIPKIELQTNGRMLWKNVDLLQDLVEAGLTGVSVSMMHPDSGKSNEMMFPRKFSLAPVYLNHWELFKRIDEQGIICRVSLNLVRNCFKDLDEGFPSGVYDEISPSIYDWADHAKQNGVRQISFRELGIPETTFGDEGDTIKKWIEENRMCSIHLSMLRNNIEKSYRLLRNLEFGPSIYDFRGLSVCILSCMTDNPNPEEIRSLILQPDGHIYHSWNFKGSILL